MLGQRHIVFNAAATGHTTPSLLTLFAKPAVRGGKVSPYLSMANIRMLLRLQGWNTASFVLVMLQSARGLKFNKSVLNY